MSNKKILWLEDKDEKDIHINLNLWCQHNGIDLIKVDDLSLFAEELAAIKANNRTIIEGFIIDLLLSGTSDLGDFKIDYKWNHLQEDGGLILIKKVLQSKDFEYQNIPILVLSVRTSNIQELEDIPELTMIQKRSHLNRNWEKEIKQWITNLSQKN